MIVPKTLAMTKSLEITLDIRGTVTGTTSVLKFSQFFRSHISNYKFIIVVTSERLDVLSSLQILRSIQIHLPLYLFFL